MLNDDALISVDEARKRVAEGDARLLLVGKEEPPAALPPGAFFARARAFRDGPSRGVAGPAAMKRLCARCGISADTFALLANGAGGPHAALAYWTLALYGHAPLALVDGAWPEEEITGTGGTPAATNGYLPGPPRFDAFRATREDVRRALENESAALLDVRSPAEFAGTLTAPADAPQEGILRGGHLPGAINVPWGEALRADGAFRPRDELAALYLREHGFDPSEPVVAYGRTAARACHTWFVLTALLRFEAVRVYDGGWAEWGNLVAAPIARNTA